MSTTTATPHSGVINAKSVIVKVRSHATTKLEFLRVLVKKITESSQKGVTATATYAKRAWNWAPAGVTGSLVSGFTSSKAGYSTASGVVRKGLSIVSNSFVRLIKFADAVIDFAGSAIAWIVSRVWPIGGSFIAMGNKKFTTIRGKAISYLEETFAGLGYIIKAAYNTDTTVTATTLFSALLSLGFALDVFFSNMATNFVKGLPVVGKLLATSLSGGTATIVAIVVVATIGATASFYMHQSQIIDYYLAETAKKKEVKTNETIRSFVNKVAGKMQVIKVQTKDTQDDKVIVTSEVVRVDGPDTYIEVTGNVSQEEAVRVAEAHIEADLAEFSEIVSNVTPVRPPLPPKQRDYPKGKQKKRN